MSPRWWLALWSSLYEPRTVTAATVAAYLVSAAAGMSLWTSPPPMDQPAVALRVITTLLLVGGGAVGTPAAWRGLWWLERVAALAVAAGIVLAAILAVASHMTAGGSVWLTGYGMTMGLLAMLTRYLRTRRAPYAPGRGPQTVDQQAARLRAVIESEADQQKRRRGQ